MLFHFIETAVILIVILSVLVIIHELGHFLMARRFGIKVEEFGFGFPPRAFGIKKGETLYSINWLPIGGFVKLYGEDEAGGGQIGKVSALPKKDLERAFFTHPAWQRAVVVFAGVAMNIFLAAIIFYAMFGLTGFKTQVPLLGSYHFFGVNQQTIPQGILITEVEESSPAQKAGIRSNSTVVTMNGKKINSADPLTMFQKIIKADEGKNITLVLHDNTKDTHYTVQATPRIPKNNQGALGIGINYLPVGVAVLSYDTPIQKLTSGVTFTVNMVAYTIDTFVVLIAQAFQTHSFAPISNNVAGPIGIGKVVGSVSQIPNLVGQAVFLLFIAGIISVSLAIMNVLPIPALDGGRLFFILFEMVTGKKMKPEVEGLVHTIGFFVLIFLIIIITIHDIGFKIPGL
jgi:regulator of sigma E protease